MSRDFYNEDAPMPFSGVFEEEPEVPDRRHPRQVWFTGGLLGPMGYMTGPMYPFLMGPVKGFEEEEEDPNP